MCWARTGHKAVDCDRPDRMRVVRAVVADFQRALQRPAGNGQVVDRLVLVTMRGLKGSGSSRRLVFFYGLSTQVFHDCFVVRFIGDFFDELSVGDFALGIYHDHGATKQTCHG